MTVAAAATKRGAVRLVEKLYELKTGTKIKTIALPDLSAEWRLIPRRRTPNARYAAQCASTLDRFVEFVRQHSTQADETAHVTQATARAFMESRDRPRRDRQDVE